MLTCACAARSFEIYSGTFQPGTICTGSNGCTAEIDADTGCSHYLVLVAPQEWEPYHPGGAQASTRIFDGNNDYVLLPHMSPAGSKGGTFPTLSIDVWIKWLDTQGSHPIMNEDHWDEGALHYQIHAGEYGFDVAAPRSREPCDAVEGSSAVRVTPTCRSPAPRTPRGGPAKAKPPGRRATPAGGE